MSSIKPGYRAKEDVRNYAMDPDWYYKLEPRRLNMKALFLFLALGLYWLRRRERQVNEFDRQKRMEQRNMQNSEVEEVYGKHARFLLFDSQGK